MPKNTVEPVESAGVHASHDSQSKRFSHPAFGQIGASRVSGQTTLYGSDFLHQHFVTIRIHRSTLNRDLNRDWHFGERELIEVALSEAQWATFVSSMNVGHGVPCTIQRVQGEVMPSIPHRIETDVVKQEFSEMTKDLATVVDAVISEVDGEIGAALSKVKRERIVGRLKSLRSKIASSLPFVAKSFEEHMEQTVEKAKVEVNAYMQTTIQRAGLAAIASSDMPLALGAGDGTNEAA